ncbi:unnamed protein product, partial [Gadus morhua 'NCC']
GEPPRTKEKAQRLGALCCEGEPPRTKEKAQRLGALCCEGEPPRTKEKAQRLGPSQGVRIRGAVRMRARPAALGYRLSTGHDCSVEVRPAGAALRRPQSFVCSGRMAERPTGVLLVSHWC